MKYTIFYQLSPNQTTEYKHECDDLADGMLFLQEVEVHITGHTAN